MSELQRLSASEPGGPILITPTWTQRAFAHGADADPEQPTMLVDTLTPIVPAVV